MNHDYQPAPKQKRTARLKQCNKSNRLLRRYIKSITAPRVSVPAK
jgi:hypothetical protein